MGNSSSGGWAERTAWLNASKDADLSAMRCLLRDNDLSVEEAVNLADNSGKTASHYAAVCGHKELLSFLIRLNASMNSRDSFGYTPLHHACEKGHVDMVEAIIDAGGDIRASARHRITPLHCASKYGRTDVIKVLLENKADVNAPTSNTLDQNTALHYATETRNWDAVALLIEFGADPLARNASFEPALTVEQAHFSGRPELQYAAKSAPHKHRVTAFLLGLSANASRQRRRLKKNHGIAVQRTLDASGQYATNVIDYGKRSRFGYQQRSSALPMRSNDFIKKEQIPIRRSFALHPLYDRSVLEKIVAFLDPEEQGNPVKRPMEHAFRLGRPWAQHGRPLEDAKSRGSPMARNSSPIPIDHSHVPTAASPLKTTSGPRYGSFDDPLSLSPMAKHAWIYTDEDL